MPPATTRACDAHGLLDHPTASHHDSNPIPTYTFRAGYCEGKLALLFWPLGFPTVRPLATLVYSGKWCAIHVRMMGALWIQAALCGSGGGGWAGREWVESVVEVAGGRWASKNRQGGYVLVVLLGALGVDPRQQFSRHYLVRHGVLGVLGGLQVGVEDCVCEEGGWSGGVVEWRSVSPVESKRFGRANQSDLHAWTRT